MESSAIVRDTPHKQWSKGKQVSEPQLEKKRSPSRGRLDLNQLVGNWTVKFILLTLFTLGLHEGKFCKKKNKSSNFSILLTKSTKFAMTTLFSTTFRQPGALVGVSDCCHKLGSLAPCRENFGAAGSSVGISHTCYPDHMSLEETG